MSDILLLGLASDAEATHPLLGALVEDRQDVFLLELSGAGGENAEALRAIESARCVVLCWTGASASEEAAAFHFLARHAARENKAVSALLENAELPALASGTTVYDLRGWRSRPTGWRLWFDGALYSWIGGNFYMRDYVTAVRYKVAGKDPPPPTAPQKMRNRQLLASIPAILTPITLGFTLYGYAGDLGLTDRPSAEEAAAFEKLDKASCPALRTFLQQFPEGPLAGKVQARLDGRTTKTEQQWADMSRKMPIYVGDGMAQPVGSEALAKADLDERVKAEAARICGGLAEAGSARLEGLEVISGETKCRNLGDGFRCTFGEETPGEVQCRLKEPRDVEVERCAAKEKQS